MKLFRIIFIVYFCFISCHRHSYLYEYVKVNAVTGDTISDNRTTNGQSTNLFLLKSNKNSGFYFTNSFPKYDTFKLSKRCDTCLDISVLVGYDTLLLKNYSGKYKFVKKGKFIYYHYQGLISKSNFKFKHYFLGNKDPFSTYLPYIDDDVPTIAYMTKYIGDTSINILGTVYNCYVFEERPYRGIDPNAFQIYYLTKKNLLPIRIERKSKYENIILYWCKRELCKHCDSIANIDNKNSVKLYQQKEPFK